MRPPATNSKYSLHVIIPLFFGGLIYLCFRSHTLLIFSWIRALHLYGPVAWLSEHLVPLSKALPEWMIYSLPGGLWLYSFIMFFAMIWWLSSKTVFYLFTGLAIITAFGGELLQHFHLVNGSFSLSDILFYLMAIIASGVLINLREYKYDLQETC